MKRRPKLGMSDFYLGQMVACCGEVTLFNSCEKDDDSIIDVLDERDLLVVIDNASLSPVIMFVKVISVKGIGWVNSFWLHDPVST